MENVDFPAIAICNVNRISRESAINLAQELYIFIELHTNFIHNFFHTWAVQKWPIQFIYLFIYLWKDNCTLSC